MKSILAIAAMGLCLAGCETITPEQLAAQNAQASRTVECRGQEDCDVKWGRATRWVLDNSEFKIRSQSETMIATMGPLPNDPTPAFTITKIALGQGAYEFDFRGGCDNMFGCVPSMTASRASFVNAVMDGVSTGR
ncbi:MAG: hypothetical protein P4L64_03860 [Caulobacteraceae bacterium]|nr:hypothetical protein [Caulobacteraceae bacterium]